MRDPTASIENHRSHHIFWLRAAVLGANDGIISTSSLIVGVAAAELTHENVLLTGVAGLVAGAMSMAAGEYVSVSSQSDTEKADLDREKAELTTNFESEHEELAQIYVARGLEPSLAKQVAQQLMQHDAIGSHARDELGMNDLSTARPVQAAFASAAAFTVGGAFPLSLVVLLPHNQIISSLSLGSLFFLAVLGIVAAKVGGASALKGALRVFFGGALAMLITWAIGALFGTSV